MKKLRVLFLTSITILFTISCEIGLGAYVDTEAPSLEISNPPADAVIRDNFAITGTWKDDGTISKVTVDMVRLDNKTTYSFTGNSELSGTDAKKYKNGSWKVVITPELSKIIDGNYEALVAITDDAGHVTTMARSFTIDNTPPVMLLSRPSVAFDQAGFDTYGRSFTLEGKAADDNGVGLIEVNVFDLNNPGQEPLKTVELKNLPHTIEQDVAVYASDKEAMKINYAAIYGHTDENGNIKADEMNCTEQRYCTLMIYDDSQRYPSDGSEQTEADKKGNSTNIFYMDSEINSKLQGKYKITELYNIKNGSYAIKAGRSADVTSEVEEVTGILENAEVTKTKFSINPSNNPKYIVTSAVAKEENKDLDHNDYQFTAGNRYLEVEITPGLDGYAIEPDSVGVYLQECDVNGIIDVSKPRICLIDKGADKHIITGTGDPSAYTDKTVGEVTVSGKIYKFKTSNVLDNANYGVKIGNYYVVIVEGNDAQGAVNGKIISNGKYAFKLVSNTEKIELSASGVPQYISKDEAAWSQGEKYIENKFTVTLNWKGGEAPFFLYRGSDLIQSDINVFTAQDILTYSQLKALGPSEGEFPEKLSYTLKNAAGEVISTTATINLNYDTTTPSISNIQFANAYEKVVKKNENETEITYYLNNTKGNKFNISGIATDDTGIETVKLEIPGLETKTSREGRFNFDEISFDSLTSVTNVIAKLIATDLAGNQKTENLKIVFDNTPPSGDHLFDAKGKDLIFRIGDFDNDDISEDDEIWTNNPDANKDVGKKYAPNSYGNANTIQLRGSISDNENGSGVSMIYYKVFIDNPPSAADIQTFLSNYKTDKVRTGYFAPLSEAEEKLVFYNVKQADAADADKNYGGTKLNNTIETWKNDEGTEFQLYKFYKTITTNFKSKLSNFEEGCNYVLIIVEDNAGNVGLEASYYSINVDTAVPDVTPDTTEIFYTNGKAPLIITGTITDTCGKEGVRGAGVDKKKLKFRVGNQEALVDVKTLVSANDENDPNKMNWTVEIPEEKFTGLTDGNITIYAIAVDTAGTGNKTTPNIATVSIDKTAPNVFITAPADADSTTEGIQVNGTIQLNGTVEETNRLSSEKLKLYYTTSATLGAKTAEQITESDIMKTGSEAGEDDVVSKKFKFIKEVNNSYNWKFENLVTSMLDGETEIPDETEVYFTVASKDLAGNTGYAAPLKVIVDQDSDRPIIRLSSLALSYKDSEDNVQPMDSLNPIWLNRSEISGVVSDDDNSIEYVKAIAKDFEDAEGNPLPVPTDAEWDAAPNLYENGIWTFSFTSNGQQKLYFRVSDGNNIFTSSTTSSTPGNLGPKIMDVNSRKFGYKASAGVEAQPDDILYIKVDTDDPYLNEFSYYKSDSVIADVSTISDWTAVTKSDIPDKFGGTKKYLYLKYQATDTNGISTITCDVAGHNPVDTELISSDDKTKEYISYFDISETGIGIEAGNAKLTINIKDNAAANTGASGIDKNYTLSIDNKAPVIGFSNHKTGEQVYGSSAVTLRGSTSDTNTVTKVEYALGENAGVPLDGWKTITQEEGVIKESYTSALSWQIVFDDKLSEDDVFSYHAELLKKSVFTLYNIPEEDQSSYDTIKPVYVWIRAYDELGNYMTNSEAFYFDVIPNGDRPSIAITYPANDSSVGGTIRITGTTEIQDTSASVEKVYIQIDPSYDGTFNENWAEELSELMTDDEGHFTVTSYSIEDLSDVKVNGINIGATIPMGISSQGTSKASWYLAVNANKELNDKVNGSNRVLGIRAFAVSSTGKISQTPVYRCSVDPDAPIFGQTSELRFVQFDGAGNETASRKYESGLYLKGLWYLVGSVEDESGIRQLTLGKNNIVWTTSTGGDNPIYTVHNDGSGKAVENDIPATGTTFYNYDLKIPVGSEDAGKFGTLEYEITATDGSDSQASSPLKFTVYYDNKKPEFAALAGNGKTLTENGEIRQSNGTYTVSGTFNEPSDGNKNQSGFKRIAMFFTRTRVISGTTNLYLLDPIVEDGTNGDSNFFKIGTVNGENVTLDSGIVQKEGLYCRELSATLKHRNVLEVNGSSLSSNIRVGGLCIVENVSYRIKAIDGMDVTLEGTLTDSSETKAVTAYFALAQIIDNLSQESGSVDISSGVDNTTNGDGDFMVEGVQFKNGIYEWNASLDSSNMLDGKVKMNFVAYDAAGNYTESSINQRVLNNSPRIAGVIFGADTNLDNVISENEKERKYATVYKDVENVKENNKKYNGQDSDGNWITEYNPYQGTDKRLVIKGKAFVKPEIVGGNTGLGWSYTYKKQVGENTSTARIPASGANVYTGVGHSNDGSIRTSDLSINIDLKDFLANQIAEGEQNMVFTVWDKTDGSTLGNEESGSAKAEITLPVNIIIADTENPTAVVSPFYWKNATENSLYQNNSANGHIELENDWAASGNLNANDASLDGDAKVSGKITFDGVATDNVIVETIKAVIPGYNNGNEFIIAQRDASAEETDGWISSVTLNSGTENEQIVNHMYYKKGEEVKENASLIGDSAVAWVFELISDEYDANGKNVVTFRFHFNTEEISTKAATNVSIKFTAMDKGSPKLVGENVSYANVKSSTPGNISTVDGALTGCYRVDIVPYITKVHTNLASLKVGNWSVYNRTALGHYPVSADETIELYGFNLGDETTKPKYGTTVLTAPSDGKISFPVSNVSSSGELEITVNDVPSLNNKNYSNAKGAYSGTTNSATGDKNIYDNYYNRQPNGDNNNLLMDDLVLDVWEITPQAVVPINGSASQPVMSINPVNHDVGFAFVNGALYYSMPNGSSYSYDNFIGGFDYWTSVAMTYDSLGNSYGTAAGGDINESKADQFRIMTSRWGYADRDAGGYNRATNNLRLELIGQYDYTEATNAQGKHDGFRNFDKERIKSPSLATGAATDDSTNVYLAYYDAINDEIRFKRGGIKTTKDATWKTSWNSATRAPTFFGDYYGPNTNSTGASEAGDKILNYDKDYSKYRTVHNSWIAGQTSRITDSSGTTVNTKVITTSGNSVYAGQYVSIAAIPNGGTSDDAVIAVWWDSFNNQLLYSYNLTPNSITVGQYKQADTKWTTPVPIFGSNIGEYCKVAVIKEGSGDNAHYSVHIVGYDGLNCDVWYAYIPNFTSTENKKTCLVDSYGLIGTELNIDVALDDSGNPIPYISYYAGSCAHPKTAHWAGTTSIASATSLNSVDDYERFTGSWEVSVIPTQSKVSVDHVNIGVWKDSTGTITWSTTDGNAPGEGNIGETKLDYKEIYKSEDMGYTAGNTGYKTGGHVWGNGSKNPILGYAITKGSGGYIETAQMK